MACDSVLTSATSALMALMTAIRLLASTSPSTSATRFTTACSASATPTTTGSKIVIPGMALAVFSGRKPVLVFTDKEISAQQAIDSVEIESVSLSAS